MGTHLRVAVGSLHGETILPSSTSLPDPSTQPQNVSAAGSGHFDRMESELKSLQAQAHATQLSLKQLQTREAVDPWTAMRSDLSAVSNVDGMVLAVVGLMTLALAVVWWYLWRRPPMRPPEADLTEMPDPAVALAEYLPTPHQEVQPVANPSPMPPHTPAEYPVRPVQWNHFAQREPGTGFDPEAAANEVMRVRKYLAKKRESRSLSLERENMQYMQEWQGQQELTPIAFDLELEPELQEDHPVSFSLPTPPGEPAPQPEIEPAMLPVDAPDIVLETEPSFEPEGIAEPEREPQSESEPDLSETYDYSITLALAEESEALELWTEARELASEVLQSTDPVLQAQAQALLDRLDPLEHATRQETGVWGENR